MTDIQQLDQTMHHLTLCVATLGIVIVISAFMISVAITSLKK